VEQISLVGGVRREQGSKASQLIVFSVDVPLEDAWSPAINAQLRPRTHVLQEEFEWSTLKRLLEFQFLC